MRWSGLVDVAGGGLVVLARWGRLGECGGCCVDGAGCCTTACREADINMQGSGCGEGTAVGGLQADGGWAQGGQQCGSIDGWRNVAYVGRYSLSLLACYKRR